MNIKKKVVNHLKEYKRIILVSSKPSGEELKNILKITGVGIAIIGMVGFIIQLLVQVMV